MGAVATQANAEISYGPLGLDLMRAGNAATEALSRLVAADAESARRQVAMVDAKGNVAVHTGERCIAYAGHLTGDGVTVEANMMERDTVPAAMLAAYQSSNGDLAERLLTALDAAEAEGGDIRGKQSAAIVIASGERAAKPGHNRILDLRVEDSPEPLPELRRLVAVHRAYRYLDAAEHASIHGDVAAATESMMKALELAPNHSEIAFWSALGVAIAGQMPLAKELLARAVADDPRWIELIRRLPAAGVLPLPDEIIAELTGD